MVPRSAHTTLIDANLHLPIYWQIKLVDEALSVLWELVPEENALNANLLDNRPKFTYIVIVDFISDLFCITLSLCTNGSESSWVNAEDASMNRTKAMVISRELVTSAAFSSVEE